MTGSAYLDGIIVGILIAGGVALIVWLVAFTLWGDIELPADYSRIEPYTPSRGELEASQAYNVVGPWGPALEPDELDALRARLEDRARTRNDQET